MSRPLKIALLSPLGQQGFYGDAWPERLQQTADAVYARLPAADALTDGQFAALTSLADSITMESFAGSTLERLVNAGNLARSTYEFEKFVYGPDPVTGTIVVLPALVRRRQQEKAIWLL